ncbi:hypothetical protein TNIN_335501 [Trichonephila inaurata madagascariensis]|uniref:Uncharacterized protein n=1 Tax=Trichonephila inaurata madagascariensis TaxID=2747483 RepID=A0A8X6WQP8_9ARAC|nr:hypothetical protein TNIN_335501 [Trichonephila inaurata madagascariensis]
MLLPNIPAVFISVMADVFRNISIIQFSPMQRTTMILQRMRMTFSMMVLPTMLRTCYRFLDTVENLTFAEILKNVEQFMDNLTLKVSTEKARREEEAREKYRSIFGSIIRLNISSEKLLKHQRKLRPLIYFMCRDICDLLLKCSRYSKASLMFEFATFWWLVVRSMTETVYGIIRRFEELTSTNSFE